ncbi:hypothetical protein D3C72_669230 [compost metagenome]
MAIRETLDEVAALLGSGDYDIARANFLLRRCFAKVVVDHGDGLLRFHWHVGGVTEIEYERKPGRPEVCRAFHVADDCYRPMAG